MAKWSSEGDAWGARKRGPGPGPGIKYNLIDKRLTIVEGSAHCISGMTVLSALLLRNWFICFIPSF